MIPGSNLLSIASRVIAQQQIAYYKESARTLNDVGQYVTTLAAPVTIAGSFQPVPKSMYEQMGLDLQKQYFNLFTSNNIIDLQRDVSGDQIAYKGKRYQCQSATEWYQIDGWKQVLCVLTDS